MPSVLEVNGVSKEYLLGGRKKTYVALRDVITQAITQPLRSLKGDSHEQKKFWALEDVSFSLDRGQVLGIIGRNGAGKSTLLKILSRITLPTKGSVTIRGRVGSLLEVGTGFHPELTGRENIFLNGAILGMTKKEIQKKFDSIVDFSGVEKFLDTPVKYYSSGMHVRLAFSVAAHLEPDILIVDEVLAVGDAEFQRKCLGKMKEVTHQDGRTILFVSHNMGAIEQLCDHCLHLEKGRVKEFSNDTKTVIRNYLSTQVENGTSAQWMNPGTEFENEFYTPRKLEFLDREGHPLMMPASNDEDLRLRVTLEIKKAIPSLNIAYALYDENRNLLYWSSRADQPEALWPKLEPGICTLETSIPAHLLNEGTYTLELLGWLHMQRWVSESGQSPVVQFSIQGGLSQSPYWTAARPGILAPLIPWKRL